MTILTVVGCDRPGLTQSLADAVSAADGNWLESHLTELCGMYVGSVLVELPRSNLRVLEDAVNEVDSAGLRVTLISPNAQPLQQEHAMILELVGQDRPGIVREVTTALAGLAVNICKFESSLENGSWSGARLFCATVKLELPQEVSEQQVRDALEGLSGEIMVDFEDANSRDGQAQNEFILVATD